MVDSQLQPLRAQLHARAEILSRLRSVPVVVWRTLAKCHYILLALMLGGDERLYHFEVISELTFFIRWDLFWLWLYL